MLFIMNRKLKKMRGAKHTKIIICREVSCLFCGINVIKDLLINSILFEITNLVFSRIGMNY